MLNLKIINQTHLAKKSGVSQKAISSIFGGKRDPRISTVYLLAKAMDIRLDYLAEAILIAKVNYDKFQSSPVLPGRC